LERNTIQMLISRWLIVLSEFGHTQVEEESVSVILIAVFKRKTVGECV
jgi:hypothetical protein